MHRRVERTKSLVRCHILTRVMVDMRRSIIHNQMYSLGPCPTSRDLPQPPHKMVVVIGVKTASPHCPIKDVEGHQQDDCAMTFVLEFTSCDLPRTHWLRWRYSRQSLNVGLLVNTDHHFATPVQPYNSFITPQNLRRSRGELFVDSGRLPVARAMRLQTGRCQYAGNRGVMNPLNYCLLNNHLLKRSAIPARQEQSISSRISAGDSLDLDPLDRGKKQEAVRYALHQRWHQRRAQDNAAIDRTDSCDLIQANGRSQRCAHLDLKPGGRVRDLQSAGSVALGGQFRSGSGDHRHPVYSRSAFGLSPCSLPPCGEAYFGKGQNTICSKTYSTVH